MGMCQYLAEQAEIEKVNLQKKVALFLSELLFYTNQWEFGIYE